MNLPVILWGSSYSAALVFELAAKHPKDVSALLAFSPGEYLGPGTPVTSAAAKVRVPVFISVGSAASETAEAQPIFAAVTTKAKTFYRPKIGVHGSSTLIPSKNAAGADANWKAVDRFLSTLPLSRGNGKPPED
jgi:pimeloyl-ACP methyl ester carboxylesterase